MTRVLMVYHDIDVADVEADALRRAGYEVDRCAGPVGGSPCPVLHGDTCWQVNRADVLLYDTWNSDLHGEDLVGRLRAIHPDTPLVLTSSRPASPSTAWRDIEYAPTRASLVGAIERARRARKPRRSATRPLEEPSVTGFPGPRW